MYALALPLALIPLAAAQSPSAPPASTVTPAAVYQSTSIPQDNAPPAVSGTSPLPLTKYAYQWPNVPVQVNPFPVGRGPQFGYNQCNGTTEGPTSNCQNAFINDITDFCLWGSPTPDATIGDVEAEVVAYCTKEGYGTRLIPPGAIQGVQFIRTSAYIQVVGFIDQTALGLQATDSGGELDPHGADLLGNPLGGLVYSDSLPTSKNGSGLTQATSWNNFVGGNQFCFKLCDPTIATPNYCENKFDLLGCLYNMPSDWAAINNTYTDCEGDLQIPVGTYVANGVTSTWSQPSVLPSSLPWQPVVPSSSNCKTYSSEALFATAAGGSAKPTGTGATASGNNGGSGGAAGATGTSGSNHSSAAMVGAGIDGSMIVMAAASLMGLVAGGAMLF